MSFQRVHAGGQETETGQAYISLRHTTDFLQPLHCLQVINCDKSRSISIARGPVGTLVHRVRCSSVRFLSKPQRCNVDRRGALKRHRVPLRETQG